MFLMIILESLGVKPLYMFLRMKGQSWMLKLGSVSSLVMVKMNLAIVSMILLRRNLLEAVMLCSLKTKQLKILTKLTRLIFRVVRA